MREVGRPGRRASDFDQLDRFTQPGHVDLRRDVAAIIAQPGVGVRHKLAEWLGRYGIAECAGITCALLGSFVVRRATGSAIAAAYGGAWGESIGYSGVIIVRDMLAESRAARAARRAFGVGGVRSVVTGLVAEFGPAGLLDTLVTRPFAMALGARLLGPRLGVVAGKFAADVLFYIPVIAMYERRKRSRRRTTSS